MMIHLRIVDGIAYCQTYHTHRHHTQTDHHQYYPHPHPHPHIILTLPHLTSPHHHLILTLILTLTLPHITLPHLSSPHLTSPHLTSPHLTLTLTLTLSPPCRYGRSQYYITACKQGFVKAWAWRPALDNDRFLTNAMSGKMPAFAVRTHSGEVAHTGPHCTHTRSLIHALSHSRIHTLSHSRIHAPGHTL